MPRAVVIALNWAFAALVLLAVFQLLTDLLTLLAMLVRRHGLPFQATNLWRVFGTFCRLAIALKTTKTLAKRALEASKTKPGVVTQP